MIWYRYADRQANINWGMAGIFPGDIRLGTVAGLALADPYAAWSIPQPLPG